MISVFQRETNIRKTHNSSQDSIWLCTSRSLSITSSNVSLDCSKLRVQASLIEFTVARTKLRWNCCGVLKVYTCRLETTYPIIKFEKIWGALLPSFDLPQFDIKVRCSRRWKFEWILKCVSDDEHILNTVQGVPIWELVNIVSVFYFFVKLCMPLRKIFSSFRF